MQIYSQGLSIKSNTVTFTSKNPADNTTQSIAIQGGSFSFGSTTSTITGGAVTFSAGLSANLNFNPSVQLTAASLLATSTIPKGQVSWSGTGVLASTTTAAQSISSVIGNVVVSSPGTVLLTASNTTVGTASFSANNVLASASSSASLIGNALVFSSNVTDIVFTGTGSPVTFTATTSNITITAHRSASIASSFATTALSTSSGDITFTDSQKFRWLSSQAVSVSASGPLLSITETNQIVGTTGITNDVTFSSSADTTWSSNDLLVSGTKVNLQVTKALGITAANSIYVRAEQQNPTTFSVSGNSLINSNNGSIAISAGSTSSLTSSTSTAGLTAGVAILESAAGTATLEATNALTFTTVNMTVASFGDVSLFTRTNDVTFTSGGAFSVAAARNFQLNGGLALSVVSSNFSSTSSSSLRVDASQLLATAVKYNAQSITTQVGTLTQTGGSISLGSTNDAVRLQAANRVILGAANVFSITTPQNITLLGNSGTFAANNLISTATASRRGTSLRLTGTNVLLFSDSGNDIHVSSAQRIVLTSGNAKPITFTGASDRLVNAGSLNVQTSGAVPNANRNNTLESVSFDATGDGANVVLFSSGGFLNLRAPNLVLFNSSATGFFTANGVVDAVNDITVLTQALNNGGGINIQSYGVTHDAVYGTDTGATLHSEGPGDLIVKSEKNQLYVFSQTNADFTADAGQLDIFAGSRTNFTSGANTNIVAQEGSVSLVAQLNSVTLTTGKDFDVQTTRNASFVAGYVVSLQSTQPITQPNNVALEFGTNSGDLNITAQGLPSVIAWNSTADTTIYSGTDTDITALTDLSVTTASGYIQVDAETGLTVNITDGQLTLTGQQYVFVQSAANAEVAFTSGQDQRWTSLVGEIYHVSQGAYEQRTSGNDLTVQAKAATGDVLISGANNIAFQADGTDSTVGGGGIDGIFINAQNIDWSARNSQTWEVLGSVIVGSRSNARVAIETGGDITTNRGFTSTSEGNTVFNTEQSVENTAAFGFYINATSAVNILSPGPISIESLGTSGVGKNVVLETPNGQFFLHGATASLESSQAATFQSGGVLQLESIGTSATTNLIKAQSGNAFNIEVVRDWTVTAGTWSTFTDSFYQQLDNDVVLRTAIGGKGAVLLSADTTLTIASDFGTDIVASSANAASLTIDAYSPNSPIDITADDATSRVLLTASGTLSSSAATVTTISGQLGVDIVAYDNSLAGTAGDVSISSFGTFEVHAGNNIELGGAKGVTLESTDGVKDIELSSTGTWTALSRSTTSVNAIGGDLRVTSGRHLEFATLADAQNGTVSVTSATHMDLETHANGVINTNNHDFAFNSAVNVLLVVENGGATFTATETNAAVAVNNVAGGIDINGFTGVSIAGGYTNFAASRKILLTAANAAGTGIKVSSSELHGTLSFQSDSTPTGQSNTMYIAGSPITWTAPGSEIGQGWINIDSTASVVFTQTQSLTIAATIASVRTNAAGGMLISSAINGVSFSSSGSVNGLGVHVQTTNSTVGTITVNTAAASTVTATNGNLTLSTTANTDPGGQLAIRAQQAVSITAGSDNFVAYSTVPESNVQLHANSLQTGDIKLTAQNTVDLTGVHGVLLDVPEGLDEGDVFTLNVRASSLIDLTAYGGRLNALTGAREGIIIKTTLDSTVLFNPTQTLNIVAGDQLLGRATNGIGIYGTTSVATTSAAGATISGFLQAVVTGSTVALSSTTATRIDGSDIAVASTANLVQITVGGSATQPTTEETVVLQAQASVIFTGKGVNIGTSRGRPIDITSDSILRIPFIFARNPLNTPNNAGCVGGAPYSGAGSFFYNPFGNRICYCTYGNVAVCYN